MSERRFPILQSMHGMRKYEALDCPKSVPWSLVAPHERQADRNHGQTLARLAERGGLSACELVAVLEDRDYRRMTDEAAVTRLKQLAAPPPSVATGEGGEK